MLYVSELKNSCSQSSLRSIVNAIIINNLVQVKIRSTTWMNVHNDYLYSRRWVLNSSADEVKGRVA